MDNPSRQRMPAPSDQNINRRQLPEPEILSATTSLAEINDRVDPLALVQNTLKIGATPTLVARIAMLIAQMQAQTTTPIQFLRSPAALDRSSVPQVSKMESGTATI